MDLKKYLTKNGISAKVFADQVGCSKSFIHHICAGTRYASRNTARVMSEATKEQVSVYSLMGLPEPTKNEAAP